MRMSKADSDKSKGRIVESAAKLFRERGFEKVSVAEIMRDAGMTHGGFYRHFSSKEELMEEACCLAFEQSRLAMKDMGLEKALKNYLSMSHVQNCSDGCVVAALGSDISRQGAGLQAKFTQGIERQIAAFTNLLDGDSNTSCAQRKQAIILYASMLGALQLARAVDDANLAEEIVSTVSGNLEDTSQFQNT